AIEYPQTLHVRQRITREILRPEQVAVAVRVDADVEQHRCIFSGLSDTFVDDLGVQRRVVRTEARLDLLELRGIEQVKIMDHVILQQLVAGNEQAGERQRRTQRVPERDARADRLHTSW